jgi:hypothetical protein
MLSPLSLLLFSSLVFAAPHHNLHRHISPTHLTAQPDIESSVKREASSFLGTLERMTDAEVFSIYHTCHSGTITWPLADTPCPIIEMVTPQLNIFGRPESTPSTLTVHNYCSYDLFFQHLNGAGPLLETGSIPAGQTIHSPLAGTVMKVSKSQAMTKPVQIEYGAHGFYDLSLIDCLGSTNGTTNADTSACAGHEAGLQLSSPAGLAFQCASGAWCDDQVYLYEVSPRRIFGEIFSEGNKLMKRCRRIFVRC